MSDAPQDAPKTEPAVQAETEDEAGFPVHGAGFKAYFDKLRADMKVWARKEMELSVAGKNADERKAENP